MAKTWAWPWQKAKIEDLSLTYCINWPNYPTFAKIRMGSWVYSETFGAIPVSR
jgi:hypothetical protein